jgi:acyl-CoA thioesterase-2
MAFPEQRLSCQTNLTTLGYRRANRRIKPIMTRGTDAFIDLVETVLVLAPEGDDRFRAAHPAASIGRVYGGQLAAQGLRAAAHTTDPAREVHSLHVDFLRLGEPGESLVYLVQRLRDSSSFSTRAVAAWQGDRLLASLTASFQVPRPGLEHGIKPTSSGILPHPESLPRREEQIAAALGEVPVVARVPWPIDLRYVDHEPWRDTPSEEPSRIWLRGDGALTDDPVLHACVFAYASDLTMFEPVIARHAGPPHHVSWERVSRGEIRGATLDHTIWFHRPFRADEWLLHERDSAIAHGSRGLATGRYFTADGGLVASVAQEVALMIDPQPGATT